MKKIIILIVLGCFSLTNIHCQTHQDSLETYNKINKWAVVKLTIAYMEDLRAWSPEMEIENVKDSFIPEFEDYISLEKKHKHYSELIDLKGFMESLNRNWSGTNKAVFENYMRELVDSISTNDFENIRFVPAKASTHNRTRIIQVLNDKYSSLLPKVVNEDEKIEEEVISPKRVLNSTAIDNSDTSNFGNILVYLALTIAFMLSIFLIFKLLKTKKKIKHIEKSIKRLDTKGLESQNKEFQNTIKSLENTIESLQKENSNLKNQQYIYKHQSETDEIKYSVESEKATVVEFEVSDYQEGNRKLIYFPSPFENNRFANEDVSETEKPSSLYIAEINKNTNRGIISLIETADLSRALNSPNTYLETVCNFENAYNSSVKGIKVVKDGEVVLEGEDWIVKPKIRIKFI